MRSRPRRSGLHGRSPTPPRRGRARGAPSRSDDAVERLDPVALVAGGVDVLRQLVHPRQRVEDDRAALRLLAQQLAGHDVLRRREAGLAGPLDARRRVVGLDDRLHVDDVGLADDVADVAGLLVVHVERVELRLELGEERHVGRADDDRLGVELREGVEDRVHRPHPHVADEQVGQPVERALLVEDRVQVGEDLGRVLAPAVAAVDDRHGRPLRRLVRRALLEVADRDDVRVVLQHVERVLDRLLVEVAGAGHLRVGEAEDVPAEAVHRGLVARGASACWAGRRPSAASCP